MIKKKINTKQVGELFGVDDSTVRRWAISGKIKCTTTAGGHRNFSYKNIIDFSKNQKINFKPLLDFDINDKSNIVDSLLHSMLHLKISPIENLLIKLYLNSVHLSVIMDDYVESSLIVLQDKLDNNDISVAEEHISRKILSKALNNFRDYIAPGSPRNDKKILCLNLENDIPDLPIDMIQILLESINYTVHNCGSNTSVRDIRNLLSAKMYNAIFIYLCDRQCCTSTTKTNIVKTNNDLKLISDLSLKNNIKLFLGGPSFKNIDDEILKNFTLFSKYADVLSLSKNI